MKRIVATICALTALLAAGCGLFRYRELPADTARLPKRAVVAGQAIGGLTIGEARERLLSAWQAPQYRLLLPDGAETVDARTLGV
ncbi:MAG TPA: hypothetical protein IAD24_04115, partial [Candidatus Aphodomorpha intestinavium]|nr:hypothetical protein [Candidatus Aphodomorpha intestinavium]